jgi:hypothetical protein
MSWEVLNERHAIENEKAGTEEQGGRQEKW